MAFPFFVHEVGSSFCGGSKNNAKLFHKYKKNTPPQKKKIPKSQVIDQFAYIILACILS